MPLNSSLNRFKLDSPTGYNIPKPKFLFYVNFVTPYLDFAVSRNLGFLVKDIDRVQIQPKVHQMNQYNRRRLVQTGVDYGPLSFNIHDTVDESALKMIEAYSKFYFGDFVNKFDQSWNYDIISRDFENSKGWGLSANKGPRDSYFFERIEIYEVYDQSYTRIDFINPKLTNIDFDNLDHSVSEGNAVGITCEYEGLVIKKVAEPVTQSIADKVGLPFHANGGIDTLNGFNIPGSSLITSTLSSFGLDGLASNILSNTGLSNFVSLNQQGINLNVGGLPVVGGFLNSPIGGSISGALAGRTTVQSPITTSNLLETVEDRIRDGQTVRDVVAMKVSQTVNNLII